MPRKEELFLSKTQIQKLCELYIFVPRRRTSMNIEDWDVFKYPIKTSEKQTRKFCYLMLLRQFHRF
jgi:hypothetical protein